jgi:hypothetical protein
MLSLLGFVVLIISLLVYLPSLSANPLIDNDMLSILELASAVFYCGNRPNGSGGSGSKGPARFFDAYDLIKASTRSARYMI